MKEERATRSCTAEELFGGKWPIVIRKEEDRLRRDRLLDLVRRYPIDMREGGQMYFVEPIDDMTDEERELMFRWLLTKPAHQSQGILSQLRQK